MYCTGGVRCERASALLQSQGEGFEQVFQLAGGIHRYVEKYGKDGCYKGKNFVFDDRMSTGPLHEQIIGHCSVCDVSFDDYTVGCRCSRCRLRILVCHDCHNKAPEAHHVCELCLSVANEERVEIGMLNVNDPRKITHVGDIVCFHDVSGSRQSCASALRRLGAKLKHYARFRCVQSTLVLDEYEASVPMNTRERPRLTWFGDQSKPLPVDGAGTRKRKVHSCVDIVMNVLDVVARAWPFDGVLGIGEGASAAALVGIVVALEESALNHLFNVLLASFEGLEIDKNAHVARVEVQRTCVLAMRAAAAVLKEEEDDESSKASSSSSSSSPSSSKVPSASAPSLLYSIFINGRMHLNADFLSQMFSFNESNQMNQMNILVPSLHLNVRTRQQRVVGGMVEQSLSFEEQETSVVALHAMFDSSPNTFVTAVDNNGQQEKYGDVGRKNKKRRKLGNDLPISSLMQQPGISIRNFACIEAMRTFLHRTTLGVQVGLHPRQGSGSKE